MTSIKMAARRRGKGESENHVSVTQYTIFSNPQQLNYDDDVSGVSRGDVIRALFVYVRVCAKNL